MAIFTFLSLPMVVIAAPATTKAENDQQKMTNLRERSDREIDRRVLAMNKLLAKINAFQKIATEQKSAFTAEIQNNITELTTLRTKIAADADLTTMRADAKSIVSSYKTFGVFMPKIHLLATIENANQVRVKLLAVSAKLEAQLEIQSADDKDVLALEANLKEMKVALADAEVEIVALEGRIIAVSTEGYPGNKGILTEGKNSMASIRKDLATARQDAAKIIAGIKALEPGKVN